MNFPECLECGEYISTYGGRRYCEDCQADRDANEALEDALLARGIRWDFRSQLYDQALAETRPREKRKL